MSYQLYDSSKNLISEKVNLAVDFKGRLKGLLGKSDLPGTESLWIKNCNSVHTFFMKFKLDLVFVDKNLKVVAIKRDVKKNRLIFPIITASHVFEFNSGSVSEQLRIGEQLNVEN